MNTNHLRNSIIKLILKQDNGRQFFELLKFSTEMLPVLRTYKQNIELCTFDQNYVYINLNHCLWCSCIRRGILLMCKYFQDSSSLQTTIKVNAANVSSTDRLLNILFKQTAIVSQNFSCFFVERIFWIRFQEKVL